jgi:hypothetical protein
MITAPPASLSLDPFNKKYADAFGIPTVASEQVPDAALLMARVQTPDELKAYAPALYAILDKVYAGHHIPADVYYGKNLKPARVPAGA